MKFIPYIIIAVLLVLLWFAGCNREDPKVITVKVPEVSGEMPEQKPVYIDRTDTVYITRWKEVIVETPNPVNEELAQKYQEAVDSIARFNLYLDAIQIRTFSNRFVDDYLDLTVSGQVQGHLLSVKPTYTIKEREVEIPEPSNPFRLLGGFELGTDLELSDLRYKVGLGFQNRSGDIIKASYGDNKTIWVGYYRSLLKF